ncbi:general substrate transporter [Lipomyces starkeyi]
MKSRLRFLLCITAICLGGAVIGIDAGIIATAIAQTSFTDFMFPPGTKNASSLLGAIVSMGSAGSAIGSLIVGLLLEKIGRKYTLAFSTFFTIVGALFQTVSNGVSLMIVGRLVAGVALGILTPTIAVFVSELARPSERARLLGVFGLILAMGFCVANWIGYACSFASGSYVWRLELAMQFPIAVILLIFCFFLPESPRWLAQKDKLDMFEKTLRTIYADEDEEFILKMQVEIREQIAIEASQRKNVKLGHALIELFSKKYIRRTAMAIAVLQVGILSGSLAIQNYQSLLYGALGFTGRKVLLISGCYGFMGVIGQIINIAGIAEIMLGVAR